MKIITLIENNQGTNPNLLCEFGFSVFISHKGKNFIFDSGQTGEFVNNIKKLKLPTKDIENFVLSHNHFDHIGGVKKYIENFGNNFTLHLNGKFFQRKYSFSKTSTRLLGTTLSQKFLQENDVKINFINEHIHVLYEDITVFTNFQLLNDFEKPNPTYFKRIGEDFFHDNMTEELVLGLDTSKGFFILCGCSHVGIVNIIKNIKIWTGKKIVGVIGGLHLSNASDERIDKTISYLKKEGIIYLATSHCTGEKFLNRINPKDFIFIKNNTGISLEL